MVVRAWLVICDWLAWVVLWVISSLAS